VKLAKAYSMLFVADFVVMLAHLSKFVLILILEISVSDQDKT